MEEQFSIFLIRKSVYYAHDLFADSEKNTQEHHTGECWLYHWVASRPRLLQRQQHICCHAATKSNFTIGSIICSEWSEMRVSDCHVINADWQTTEEVCLLRKPDVKAPSHRQTVAGRSAGGYRIFRPWWISKWQLK